MVVPQKRGRDEEHDLEHQERDHDCDRVDATSANASGVTPMIDSDATVATAAASTEVAATITASTTTTIDTKRPVTLMDLPDELLLLILDHLCRDLAPALLSAACTPSPHVHRLLRQSLPSPLRRVEAMADTSFAPCLSHTRHIRIDFDSLWERDNAFAYYLAHVWLVCLTAVNLETLELSDLVLNSGDSSSYYGLAPYKFFEAAKPLQFDLAYQFRQNVQPPSAGGRGIGFAKLKTVFLMDGNAGIRLNDYANLFLIPRHLCSDRIAEMHELSPINCSTYPDDCKAITACPSLKNLTLVLWYDQLVIDASFLRAMAHVAAHHPRLKRLNLVSRRLRYDPQRVETGMTLNEWFKLKVVPLLQLAEELFANKLQLHIYILTKDANRHQTLDAIEEYQDSFANINVDVISVHSEFSPSAVYNSAAAIHRKLCSKATTAQAWRHQGLTRLRMEPNPSFFH
ncbi:hypothetical protein sr13155 [Sporisorium reilianum SRZ2]|uniref:Uncharacterized protein n=2 Tax=Sporisorium reilianum TaxID=72558 RepID=E6ZYZ0_SPORE|nr:hypothetical protein sr13155 [Sporisorium reilianum SRZ2]SJX62309.1 uncharacterized protein SRS1_13155 [Sporisorium reilianum f. sp. reilianum]